MAAAYALSGRNAWVGIGKQAAFGTPVAPTKFYEITEVTGLLPEYEFKKSDRRVGTRFKPLGSKFGKKIPFTLAVEVNAENVGLLLALGLGADAVSAAGSAFKHTITMVENLSYFTLWASTDLVADTDAADTLHQLKNCKVISVKLDGTVDDVLKLTIEGVATDRASAYVSKSGLACTNASGQPTLTGISSTANLVPGQTITGTGIPASTKILSVDSANAVTMTANSTSAVSSFSVAAPTPIFPTSRSLYLKAEESQAKMEIGAAVGSLAQFDETTEFHLSISNGVAPDKRIDNTSGPSSLREGDSEITGSMKAMYNRTSLAEIKAFQAGTNRALRFTDTSVELAAAGQPYKIVVTTDKARYSGAPTSFDPDVISSDLQFEVEKTTGYPLVEIINTDAAAY